MRIIIFVVALISYTSFSQSEYSVSGQIKNALNEPVPFANVLIYKAADSTLISGTASDDLGNFSITLKPGNYYLKIKFLSYQEQIISSLVVSNSNINLGVIIMVESQAMLNTVEVTTDKPQMELKLDKRVFNVQQDMSNAGLNAAEILDNIPSISVDAEGNVSLRGSQNVRILVNGKPMASMSNTDILRQIDGSMIDHVEVITNPSARYDAEGEVGIINIVLKQEMKKGFNGSFNARIGYPLGYGIGFNMNYRTKQINFFGGYSIGTQQSPGSGQTTQIFNSPDTSYNYDQNSTHNRTNWSHNLNAGMDISIGKTISIIPSVNLRYSEGDNWNRIIYSDYDSTNMLIREVNRNEDETDLSKSIDINLSFRKSFKKPEQLLTLDAKRSYSLDYEFSDLYQFNPESTTDNIYQRTVGDENENNWLFQLDYIHPIFKEGKFETGLKANLRSLSVLYLLEDSLNNAWISNPLFDNILDYKENIYAAYVMVGNKSGKFSYQGGLRAEHSDITTYLVKTDTLNKRQYLRLFPSFHFSYELKNNNFLQLSYSRRISRPRHWWLTPFFTYRDARNFEAGNPNINPEYAGSYELSHLKYFKKGSFLTSIYYRHTSDAMTRIVTTDSVGITYRIPVNLGFINSFGMEFSGSLNLYKWWSLNGSFNFFRAISEGNYLGIDYSNDAYAWTSEINSKFSVGKNFGTQISFNYESPTKTNQGSIKAIYFFDISASADVLKGNGTISLNARDLLNSRKRQSIIQNSYLYQEGYFQWRSRQITLSFTYRINQKKSRNERGDFGGEGGDGGM